MTTHTRTRFARPLCLLIALAAAMAWTPARALAQGTSGTVPDPISSRELNEYAERLQLSDQQWAAIEGFFEQYQGEFKTLRETDIEAYLKSTGGLWMRGFRGLNRETIEGNMKELDRVLTRIKSLDNQLFGQIQTVLDEDQVAGLPQVMQARERQRYEAGASRMIGWSNRASRVDVAEIYRDLELSETEAKETGPYVDQYEAQLTKASRELFESAASMFLDIVEYMETQGVDLEAFEDPENRRRMMTTMMEAWAEVSRKPREKAAGIADLNRKAVNQISPLLGTEPSREFRTRYLRRAYPEIRARGGAERGFEQALALETLNATQRAEVEAAAEQYWIQRKGLTDDAASYLDEYRRESSAFRFGREGRQAHQQKLEEYRDRLNAADQTAIDALKAALGPDLAEQIDAVVISDASDGDEGRWGRGGREQRQDDEFGPDRYLPQAIGRRAMLEYGEHLGLGKNNSFILESLYEDYLSSFRHLQTNEIARLDEARRALQQAAEQEPDARTPEQIQEVFTLRRRTVSAIIALDDSFFDDLETLVDGDQQQAVVERLRRSRQRAAYVHALAAAQPEGNSGRGRGRGRGWMRGFLGAGSAGSAVDISAVVAGVELSEESRGSVESVLADYEAQVTDEFRKQYETTIDLRGQIDSMWIQRPDFRGGRDDERRRRWETLRESMQRYNQQMRDAAKPVLDLNRETMASLTETLPPEAVTAITRAYNRRAYPEIYRDRGSAERFLSRALELPDVNQDQAGRIHQILAEFNPAYEAVCDRMVDLEANAAQVDPGDRSTWRSGMERRNKMEALEFERTEVSAKALRQLRDVLSEQQVELLDLPE
jgi:hypothetical protein